MIVHSLATSMPARLPLTASCPVSRPECPDRVDLAPARVLEEAATVPAPVLLRALGCIAVQVGTQAIPAPALKGVLLATRALYRDPQADPATVHAFEDQLDRWGRNAQFQAKQGDLEKILQGAEFQVVGKTISLSAQPPENTADLLQAVPRAIQDGTARAKGYSLVALQRDLLHASPELATGEHLETQLVPLLNCEGAHEAVQLILAHYGPEQALDRLLEQRPVFSDSCFSPVLEEVLLNGWDPSPDATRRLAGYVAREAGTFAYHNSNYAAAVRVLAAVLERDPEAVDLKTREQIQDRLLAHPDPGVPAYSALYHEGTAAVAAGHPRLVERLLKQMDDPVAMAFLIRCPLEQEAWEALRARIAELPREDRYRFHFSDFARADLQRKLDPLTAQQAVERLEELRGPVEPDTARHMVFRKMCQGDPGERPHLTRVAGWFHDARPFFDVFERAAREGRLDGAREDAQQALSVLGEGLIGGHQVLAAGLMELQDGRPIGELIEMYRAVQGRLKLNHGAIGTTNGALAALALFGSGSREQLTRGLDWLALSARQDGTEEALDQVEALAKSPDLSLFRAVLERVPLATLGALAKLQEASADRRERVISLAEKTTSLGPALAIDERAQEFPQVPLQQLHDLVERLRIGADPDDLPDLVHQGLALLAAGTSLDQVLFSVLRSRVFDSAPATGSSSIGVEGGQVRVGGVVLRGRKRY
ncbi:MAG: hypothetical protein AB1758_16645 [Candidatus Eremiobacterota bacterium]